MTEHEDIENNEETTKTKNNSVFSSKNVLLALVFFVALGIVISPAFRGPKVQKFQRSKSHSRTTAQIQIYLQHTENEDKIKPRFKNVNDDYDRTKIKSGESTCSLEKTKPIPRPTRATEISLTEIENANEENSEDESEEYFTNSSVDNMADGPSAASDISDDKMIFNYGSDVYTLDPSRRESGFSYLTNTGVILSISHQLSKNKKLLYFKNSGNIKVIDIAAGNIRDTNLPNVGHGKFVLKKPDINSIVYVTSLLNIKDTETKIRVIRHCSLEGGKNVIKNYMHACVKVSSDYPMILGQFNNGSKLIYQCYLSNEVFLKDFSGRRRKDKLIHTQKQLQSLIISPDDTKVIITNHNNLNQWAVIDLTNPDPETRIHKVNINMNINPIEAHSFTRDQNILNILMQHTGNGSDLTYNLIKIDFAQLLNCAVSGETYNIPCESKFEVFKMFSDTNTGIYRRLKLA